jgi:hypothetical protein
MNKRDGFKLFSGPFRSFYKTKKTTARLLLKKKNEKLEENEGKEQTENSYSISLDDCSVNFMVDINDGFNNLSNIFNLFIFFFKDIFLGN